MIIGKRVRLRSIERSDLPRYQAWLNDPEVIDGLAHYLPFSLADEEAWFEKMLQRPLDERPLAIELRRGRDWELIGNEGLFDVHAANRSAELGIFIGDKSKWNKGYGTEALELLLQHGFHTLNLHRIFLRVYANNLRAQKSYEKAGFQLEGTMREAVFRNGRYLDVLIMGILRSEWKGSLEGR